MEPRRLATGYFNVRKYADECTSERIDRRTVGTYRQNEMKRESHRKEKVHGIDELENNKMLA